MISEENDMKKNYLIEFDLYIDIVLIVCMLCVKILFFFKRLIWEESKKTDAQGGVTNKQTNK